MAECCACCEVCKCTESGNECTCDTTGCSCGENCACEGSCCKKS